jgi:hypothetical protein
MAEPTDTSGELGEAPDEESFKRLLAELDTDPAFRRRLEEVERLEAAGEVGEAVSIREYFRQLRARRDVRPVPGRPDRVEADRRMDHGDLPSL